MGGGLPRRTLATSRSPPASLPARCEPRSPRLRRSRASRSTRFSPISGKRSSRASRTGTTRGSSGTSPTRARSPGSWPSSSIATLNVNGMLWSTSPAADRGRGARHGLARSAGRAAGGPPRAHRGHGLDRHDRGPRGRARASSRRNGAGLRAGELLGREGGSPRRSPLPRAPGRRRLPPPGRRGRG